MERKLKISQKDIQFSSRLGGIDLDFDIYRQQEQATYCDKGGHKERSIVNYPVHQEYWKKHERLF